MKLLAIDTATEACSAALYQDSVITERYEVAPRKHGELILAMTDALLAESGLQPEQLDAIAFGCGPGAFTGVRLAAGVVQGMAFAADLPVVPVSDLAAVAMTATHLHQAKKMLVCLDARMQEVYWALYQADDDGSTVVLQGQEQLSATASVQVTGSIFAAGPGWSVYPELAKRLAPQLLGSDTSLLPRAAAIARLAAPRVLRGEAVSADRALPVYLRNEVAWKKT